MIGPRRVLMVLVVLVAPAMPARGRSEPAAPAVSVPAWIRPAPALPPPAGAVIRVEDVAGLFEAARRVPPGGTIAVADGTYALTRTLVLATDGVTLRGASGDRARVVLDGGGTLGEAVAVRSCAGATIADLTVQNVRWNGIKLDTDTGVQRATIRNCILRNIWQRAVKGVKVPEPGRERTRPRGCIIEYCLFVNDRPKRFEDDPADTAANFGGNYVGGIDAMYPTGWTIRDNVFVGIKGRSGSARGAIFLWHDARDCVVERNVILDCDSGICLGNSSKPDDVAVHATGLVVRNNFLCRVPENGILADYTRDCAIVHNTVHDPSSRLGRLVRVVHDNPGLRVENNLLSGPPVRVESESAPTLRGNEAGDFTRVFVAPESGNLRLTAGATAAIGKAVPLPEVTTDIDGRARDAAPDVGAHEFAGP
jgi:nitrous oxidase accessory protein NosD